MTVSDQRRGAYRISASAKGSLFGEEEANAVRSMLLSDVHLADGTICTQFEADLRDYLGAADVVTTSSCTMALELVTRYLGLSARDKVVACPLTYQSTTASLLDRGCEIAWCDVDADTLGMSPHHLRELLSSGTKAVYLTHYGGDAARIDEICSLAHGRGAVVVEDCAHALGTTLHGRAAGTFGDFGCFSFHSLKNMSTLGTGGAIAVRSQEAAAVLRTLRHMEPHARLTPRQNVFGTGSLARPLPVGEGHEGPAFTHDCREVLRGGTNAVMSDVAAAVGRVQLRKLPEFLAIRAAIAARLDSALQGLPGITTLPPRSGVRHAHHLYTFLASSRRLRDAVLHNLHVGGVEIVQRYFPLNLRPEYRMTGGHLSQCPTADSIWFERLVNLPIHPRLTDADIDHMTTLIRAAATANVRS
jgi:perosamine synthetase